MKNIIINIATPSTVKINQRILLKFQIRFPLYTSSGKNGKAVSKNDKIAPV